jgi:hypothetical protein
VSVSLSWSVLRSSGVFFPVSTIPSDRMTAVGRGLGGFGYTLLLLATILKLNYFDMVCSS